MKQLRNIAFLALTLTLTACADNTPPTNPQDPYENFNRKMFTFNMALDHMFLKPAATLYNQVTPDPLQIGIHNAFHNVHETVNVGNDLLQAKFTYALADTTRFIINSTFGVFGLFDVATKMGLPYHHQDFGMTLSTWGGGTRSAYLILPLWGPETMASGYGIPFDYFMYLPTYYPDGDTQYLIFGARMVTYRAQYLAADQMIKDSFDPYAFVRDFYLKDREMIMSQNDLSYSEFRKQYYAKQAAEASATTADATQHLPSSLPE